MNSPTIINFKEGMSVDEQLDFLFKFHKVSNPVTIDEPDKPMIVIALNRLDIEEVSCDDDGGLTIYYEGDGWEEYE